MQNGIYWAMDKIELTDLQKQLIQKQLNEKYDPFMATEENGYYR